MLRSQKGITLVALVVTIVVLIILATISISVAINGGLIDTTNKAKEFYENADKLFNEQQQQLADYVQQYMPATSATTTP